MLRSILLRRGVKKRVSLLIEFERSVHSFSDMPDATLTLVVVGVIYMRQFVGSRTAVAFECIGH